MNIESILAPERTCCCLTASSKKKAIEEAARLIANVTDCLGAEEIYERLISREKLGTTAIGHGVAIPHCRLSDCSEVLGGLFKLETPIDFDAFDDEPVSILFVLLVPEVHIDDHLKTLAMLAERFESDAYRSSLLGAKGDRDLYERAITAIPE